MALSQSALSELLEAFRAGEGVDLIRDAVRVALQELIEAEATEVIGAGRYERTESRTTERNGSRPRVLTTKAGDVQLAIPKLRKGSFFPEILDAAPADRPGAVRGGDGGLRARGVHPRAWTTWSPRWAGPGSPSPRCRGSAPAWTRRSGRSGPARLGHAALPVRVPGRDLPARARAARGQVVSKAVVVATGVTGDGGREILGLDVGDSEDETFWREFLTELKDRGLAGVRLVISDQHAGLVKALSRCFAGRRAPTLPGPLRPQPARPGPQVPQGHGRRAVPHDLRPTRRQGRARHLGPGPRPARHARSRRSGR